MLYGKRIAVVLPAYNAARTLEKTVAEIPADVVDTILLVDDSSKDETIEIAHRLGLQVFPHAQNYGYGRKRPPSIFAEAWVFSGLPFALGCRSQDSRHSAFR